MCRWEGDFDWYVEAESVVTLGNDQGCEDCGRIVPTNEAIVQFLVGDDESERDDSPYVCVAQYPVKPNQVYIDPDHPMIRLSDEDPSILDAFDALGFVVEETCEYDITPHPPVYHYSCRHCRAANIWLVKVCDQSTVLVTVEDLAEHWNDYTPEQLGQDFGTLYELSRKRWVGFDGDIVDAAVVKTLAEGAAQFALAGGIVGSH